MTMEHVDVLVVGAGISGISAGWHLQRYCPKLSYAIVEAREELGGTWSLFRYPGIRSDSDMFTLGFAFRPWTAQKSIADGPTILQYLRDTAREFGIDRHIRLQHRIRRASWSSADSRWTVEVERGPQREVARLTCGFLFTCSGYYDYARGYQPDFPGAERYAGRLFHPQQWPEDLDWTGRKVLVIGSGATAMSIVPAMAERAQHVTMLQRSPTYVVARPSVDPIAQKLRRWLPTRLAYAATRWKNVLMGMYIYRMCKREPQRIRDLLLKGVRMALGPDYDVARHFTPRYNPWDQRLCLLADGDVFKAIRSGKASIVTDEIDTFDERGVRTKSGEHIDADIVISATGLELKFMGGVEVFVDGQRVDMTKAIAYRGCMYSDVPNLASTFGYANASWTLKADLVSRYVCRVLRHMRRVGATQCVPRLDPAVQPAPFMDLTSGYVQRGMHRFPRQGATVPWRLRQVYPFDLATLRYGRIDDGTLQFSGPPQQPIAEAVAAG